MNEVILITLVILFLAVLQSIVGVGILVIGTPFLLILNYDIISILSLLLPISIITSLLNLIFFKLNKKKLEMKLSSNTKYLFFFVCLPSIFIGLFFLELYKDAINFQYSVAAIIFFSFIIMKFKKFILKINDKIKVIFLFLIGIIHGVTNSGGTLLSLFMSAHLKKNNSRYGITFFYFFLAVFQFIIFNLLFVTNIDFIYLKYILIFLPLSVIMGNFIIKYIDEKIFKILIETISLITCVCLILL